MRGALATMTPASLVQLVGAVVLTASFAATSAYGQERVAVFGDGEIPDKPFTSWSLFLMCNPEWLTAKKKPALRQVFEAYVAFARTTGDRHAGVWFVVKDGSRDKAADLDVERNVRYCQKFNLTPGEGPHVVVVTTHPDQWKPTDAVVMLALGGSDTGDIITLFRKLNDQIVTEQLSQKALTSKQYWLSWVRVLEKGCKLLDNVKFMVTAEFVKVEKTGVCR